MPIEFSGSSATAGSADPAVPAHHRQQSATSSSTFEVAGRLRGLSRWVEAQAMFIVAACAVVGLSLAGIPHHFSQDGWLALVAGRVIAQHGVPHHDYFTAMAHGVQWVDQQWLAQLLMYELVRIGGLQLLTVLYVLVTGAAFTGAIAAARSLGAEDLHVLAMLPAGAFFYLTTAVSIRTQGFVYPLFVGVLWLLASEARSPVRHARVYWVFPMLLLWANLHGSVTLGVGLAVIYGVTVMLSGLRTRGVRGLADRRGLAFIALSPLALLATPYGTHIVHYYDATLMNSQFSHVVTEWKPVTSVPILAVPLFILMAVTVGVLIRVALRARAGRARQTPLFDLLALAVLAYGAVTAVRNITWFGLAVMILLPPAWTQMKGGVAAPLRRTRLNQVLAVCIAAITTAAVVIVVAQPATWFTSTYPVRAIPTLERLVAKDPKVKIFADVRYADWLIWKNPHIFAGRVAYDTSFELLTAAQLDLIADPAAKPKHGSPALSAYGVWMLYPVNHATNRSLLKHGGVRTITRNAKVIIATTPSVAQQT
jgi:hypothetical protein